MKTKILLALIALLILAINFHQKQSSDPFELWKLQYQPSWGSTEEYYRRAIFYKNLAMIEKHNIDQTSTYKLAVNQFTVLTQAQFESIYLTAIPPTHPFDYEERQMPTAQDIDWTSQGKVSVVKNQGNCGSCWAFSAVAAAQSWSLFQGKQVSLSEQQLVDCSASYGNNGCNGGWSTRALDYIRDKGISSSSQYPYTARDGQCSRTGQAYFKINSYINISGCDALVEAIQSSPISVSVDASNWSFYSSGVFNNCATNTNHAVFLVGIQNGNWKIKNSWGVGWGQSGYIRLASGNTCGICIWPSPYIPNN